MEAFRKRPCDGDKDCAGCAGRSAWAPVSRRRFLTTTVGLTVATTLADLEFLDFAPEARGEIPRLTGGPRVKVVFIRPDKEPDVSWPGGNCDVPAQQALFSRTLQAAARELGVTLEVRVEPLNKQADIAAYLDQLKQAPPDGLIVCAQSLVIWPTVSDLVAKRGDIPTIIYSHVSGFTEQLQLGRNLSKTFMAATPDVEWLATAVRLFAAQWRIRNSRILMLTKSGPEFVFQPWGTTVRPVDNARFQEEFKRVETSAEMRAVAAAYTKAAARIVEPTREEILDAAKNYFVCRRLMEVEQCHGITIACLGWKNPVCLAFSKLLDEGVAAVCEADQNAIMSELLSIHVFNRPGFIQDPSPNTVDNTFIGSHCTSPTRLDGYENKQRASYWLRSYHTRTGCSLEVMWPVGHAVTVLQASAQTPLVLVGTGKVRGNISQPPTGCCRTAVELTMDNVADTRDVRGFHQLFIAGNHVHTLQAYGRLFDIRIENIAAPGKPAGGPA